jgi:hypothetical protein
MDPKLLLLLPGLATCSAAPTRPTLHALKPAVPIYQWPEHRSLPEDTEPPHGEGSGESPLYGGVGVRHHKHQRFEHIGPRHCGLGGVGCSDLYFRSLVTEQLPACRVNAKLRRQPVSTADVSDHDPNWSRYDEGPKQSLYEPNAPFLHSTPWLRFSRQSFPVLLHTFPSFSRLFHR